MNQISRFSSVLLILLVPLWIRGQGPAAENFKVRFLIPLEGDVFYENSFNLVASLSGFSPHSIGLVKDGRVFDSPLKLKDGILTAELRDLKRGKHRVAVIFLNEKKEILYRREISFFVRLPEPVREVHTDLRRQFGRVVSRLEYRGAEAASRVNGYRSISYDPVSQTLTAGEEKKNRGKYMDGTLHGVYTVGYDRWEGSGKAVLRSNQSAYRQPSHRFSGNLAYRPWTYLKLGDVYPGMNDLILTDTRIRGMEAGLKFTRKEIPWGNFKLAYGRSRKTVEPHIIEYESGGSIKQDSVPGTYGQNLVAARFGLGNELSYDVGLTLLKAFDLGSSLEHSVNDSLLGATPIQNLVSGIDMRLGFWEGKIQVFADAAMSIYTKNTLLGPLDTSKAEWDSRINPAQYNNIIMINTETQGLGYLDNNDIKSFIKENSYYQVGVKGSTPLPVVNSETELRYSHLGYYYHSEGNRFLGSNPEYGLSVLQKLSSRDGKIRGGIEAGRHIQKFGFFKQKQDNLRTTLYYTPGPNLPSMWMGTGYIWSNPVGEYTLLYTSSNVITLSSGGYHQFEFNDSRLHCGVSYYFTKSRLRVFSDSTYANFAKTNVITLSLQYKQKRSNIVPRVAVSHADNGVQKPTSNVTMGMINTFLHRRVVFNADLNVGQYPESDVQNDLKLGESITVTWRINANQNLYFQERWLQYGKRKSVTAGVNYDVYF